MLTRLLGSILVLLVLSTLYFLTEGTPTQSSDTPTPQVSTPSDNDFKSLKIN